MFFLPKDAKFQGCDAEGFAIYAKDKPEVVTKKAFKLDPAKLAKARADRETVANYCLKTGEVDFVAAYGE